jgi:hypothetical protein
MMAMTTIRSMSVNALRRAAPGGIEVRQRNRCEANLVWDLSAIFQNAVSAVTVSVFTNPRPLLIRVKKRVRESFCARFREARTTQASPKLVTTPPKNFHGTKLPLARMPGFCLHFPPY